jgi:hypothetical protein
VFFSFASLLCIFILPFPLPHYIKKTQKTMYILPETNPLPFCSKFATERQAPPPHSKDRHHHHTLKMFLRGVFAAGALMHLADAGGYCLEIRNCCNKNVALDPTCEGFVGDCRENEEDFFYKDNEPGLLPPDDCVFQESTYPVPGCLSGCLKNCANIPDQKRDGCGRWYCQGEKELKLTLTANTLPGGDGFIAGKSELDDVEKPKGVCGDAEVVEIQKENVIFKLPSLAVQVPDICSTTEQRVKGNCTFSSVNIPGLVSNELPSNSPPISVDAKYYDDEEKYVMYARITVAAGEDARACKSAMGWPL